jgi:hypothetical protein
MQRRIRALKCQIALLCYRYTVKAVKDVLVIKAILPNRIDKSIKEL